MYQWRIFSALHHLLFQHSVLVAVLAGLEFDLCGFVQLNKCCSKELLKL